MNSIRDTFFEECENCLRPWPRSDLIEAGENDGEPSSSLPRRVRSRAVPAFALNALVAFAHRFETADGIRSDRIELTAEVMHTLLRRPTIWPIRSAPGRARG